MLQLVTKALFLCAEAPGSVDEVKVTQLTTTPIATGEILLDGLHCYMNTPLVWR